MSLQGGTPSQKFSSGKSFDSGTFLSLWKSASANLVMNAEVITVSVLTLMMKCVVL